MTDKLIKRNKKLGLAMGLGKLEGIDNEVSCCYECDQLTHDSFETYWNEKGEPFCEACFLDNIFESRVVGDIIRIDEE